MRTRRPGTQYSNEYMADESDFHDVGGGSGGDDDVGTKSIDTEEELGALKEAEYLQIPDDGFYRFPEAPMFELERRMYDHDKKARTQRCPAHSYPTTGTSHNGACPSDGMKSSKFVSKA